MDFESMRSRLVEEGLKAEGIRDARVCEAFLTVERHRFVREQDRGYAYGNFPLDIGYGQTISQPFIIALSLEALRLNGDEKVLEIGTGSGYQTALLAELAKKVVTIERMEALYLCAKTRLQKLGYRNVHPVYGDGFGGVAEHAPYAGIVVSAAAPAVPDALLEQLDEGGRLVIPVGGDYYQDLLVVRRNGDTFTKHSLCACRFVPLLKGYIK